MSRVSDEVLLGDDVPDGTGGHDPPAARSSRAWVKPGGISSTWCETSTVAGEAGSMREHGQGRDEVLATAQVESGGGLVEQQQLGIGHQGPGDLHPLALTLAEGAEGAVEQMVGADLGEQLAGPVVVEVVVRLAPAPDHAVRRGDDDVADQLVARDALGERPHWSARSAAAARRRRRCRAPRRGSRRRRRSGGSGPRRPGAAWSCRRRWGRAPPSAHPRRPATRSGRAVSPGPVGRSRRRTRSPRPCAQPYRGRLGSRAGA